MFYYLLDSPLIIKHLLQAEPTQSSAWDFDTWWKTPMESLIIPLARTVPFTGRQLGQVLWQKNFHFKQDLQSKGVYKLRLLQASIGVWWFKLIGKEKKHIYLEEMLLVVVDLASPVIRTANEPRSCSGRNFASSAVHGRSHIWCRWETGISLMYPSSLPMQIPPVTPQAKTWL